MPRTACYLCKFTFKQSSDHKAENISIYSKRKIWSQNIYLHRDKSSSNDEILLNKHQIEIHSIFYDIRIKSWRVEWNATLKNY